MRADSISCIIYISIKTTSNEYHDSTSSLQLLSGSWNSKSINGLPSSISIQSLLDMLYVATRWCARDTIPRLEIVYPALIEAVLYGDQQSPRIHCTPISRQAQKHGHQIRATWSKQPLRTERGSGYICSWRNSKHCMPCRIRLSVARRAGLDSKGLRQ